MHVLPHNGANQPCEVPHAASPGPDNLGLAPHSADVCDVRIRDGRLFYACLNRHITPRSRAFLPGGPAEGELLHLANPNTFPLGKMFGKVAGSTDMDSLSAFIARLPRPLIDAVALLRHARPVLQPRMHSSY